MVKTQTIKSQLFWNYSPIIVVFIGITMIFYYNFASRTIRERAFDTLAQISDSMTEQIDNELINMNEMSKRISYSNLVKTKFLDYLANPNSINLHFSQQALRDIFIAIMGPVDKQYQINLFDFNGKVVGAGEINTMSDRKAESMPWYQETLKREGAKYTSLPFQDLTRLREDSVVSLCRTYYDNYYTVVGIIEIQQKYTDLFGFLLENVDDDRNFQKYITTFVFGENGELIYPKNGSDEDEMLAYFKENVIGRESKALRYDDAMVSWKKSEFSGWYVLNSLPESVFLKPLYIFIQNMVLFSLSAIVISLLVSLFIAAKLTKPISQLRRAVNSLTLDTQPAEFIKDPSSDFNELEMLNASFREMHTRLKKAADDLVVSKSHESQARMLALQSKMNPHFLHNTIANISVMAEEGSNREIQKMCGNLSSMLRYISSADEMVVPLRLELNHLRQYLDLMRHRYEGNIIDRVSIPTEMEEILIPKFILQPLVENSLSYGVHVAPPWRINLSGSIDGQSWLIRIEDNGDGFSEKTLLELSDKMLGMDPASALTLDGLKGIGILNIYARMKMLYRESTVFTLYNKSGSGACVELGGIIMQSGESVV